MVINAVAPMIAPMAGGAILAFEFASWKSIFLFLGMIGIVIVIIVAINLKETLPPEKRIPSSIGATVMTMGDLLKDRRSEEHTSELQSRGHLVCRLLLEKKKKKR